ncbi:MAG: lipase family protein [Actinoallomurus sp.]
MAVEPIEPVEIPEPAGALTPLEWETTLRRQLETGGLWTRDTLGPDYARLRPYGPRTTHGFPVHPDLEARLLRPGRHPDPVVAHVLATCAAYAYAGTETVSMIMARLGLEENHCRMITSSVDAMFIRSTAFLIQSRSGRVAVLCYRGTEPTDFVSWMTDADVVPERMSYRFGDPYATVHAGFYRNVRATRYEVMAALKRACQGRSVRAPLPDDVDGAAPRLDALEALYVTGHSLGGAMAAMMGVMLRHEAKFRRDGDLTGRLRAVYTFGQPMIGDHRFARACEEDEFLRHNVIRYVYDSDVVPHLPPRTTGPYRHFGREFRYEVPHLRHSVLGLSRYLGHSYDTRHGSLRETGPTGQAPSVLGGFGLATLAFAGRRIQSLRSLPVVYSFEDHRPERYVTCLTPRGVQNEFGD